MVAKGDIFEVPRETLTAVLDTTIDKGVRALGCLNDAYYHLQGRALRGYEEFYTPQETPSDGCIYTRAEALERLNQCILESVAELAETL